ncbi:branched-chain amino acid ABC transporter permease, partial [Acinetobacter baumannii]
MSEDFGFLLALLLSGASIGLMYSLIALGFVLVYKATDAINFAQGEFVMMAGLIAAAVLAAGEQMLWAAIATTL